MRNSEGRMRSDLYPSSLTHLLPSAPYSQCKKFSQLSKAYQQSVLHPNNIVVPYYYISPFCPFKLSIKDVMKREDERFAPPFDDFHWRSSWSEAGEVSISYSGLLTCRCFSLLSL